MRTGGHLVDRGGAGVMVTAYSQAGGSGKVLAMDETDAQLKDHQVLSKSLADSADASKATPADLAAQRGIDDGLHELKKPGVLVTGPGPVGIASGDGVHVAADGSIIGTAKKGIHFSTLRRITASAREVMSFFSQKGMTLITAAGDLVAQAQRGRMQLASQGDMTVETVDGVLHVKSSKEIVLNAGGSYIRIAPGGIEFGSRGGAVFKTGGLKKIGPAQMDLGGAAFAPQFVPYTTACEVWRSNPDFVQQIAPTPYPAQWPASSDAVIPSPVEDALSRLPGGGSGLDAGAKPVAALTLNDGEHSPSVNATPDPVKLAKALPCDWKISEMKTDVTDHFETARYWGVLADRTPWIRQDGTQIQGGGARDSNYEFAYSEQDKAITCTVRVMLVPMDLFPVDVAGNRDPAAIPQTVAYESTAHWQMLPGSISNGLKMDYRDAPGDQFDIPTLRGRIEAVLNQGSYRLILDGCSKGAACGCRVKVSFRVDLRVAARGKSIAGFKPHVTNHLFPSVLRADTSAWGENYKWADKLNVLHAYPDANVEAHECGHYFNFPDEYYDQGGWLHASYIKNGQIDFSLVDAKAGSMVWQGVSDSNLMGYGRRNRNEMEK